MLPRLALMLLLAWPALPDEFTAMVVAVHDGDTITVLRGKEQVKLRLDGIDCPELAQPFGSRARQKTAELAFRRQVTIRASAKDRYGRTLAVVILPGGRSLNEELLRAGMAWWYRKYAPRNRTLANLEEAARDAGLGLWAAPDPVPPWLWRKEKKAVAGGSR